MTQDEILRDFRRRYEQSFIWVAPPDNSDENLFYVESITPDADKIATLTLSNPDFGRIILNMGSAHTLKFKYPPIGVYQHGTDAYIFRRQPAKQYKHGLCADNSYVYQVWAPLRGLRLTDAPFTYEVIADAFASKTHSFSEALKMLSGRKARSVAIGKNLSLVLNLHAKVGYTLLYWDIPIAYVAVTGEVTHILNDSFKDLIKDVQ